MAGDKLMPRQAQGFDAHGRLAWQAHHLGFVRQAAYDAESHLLRSTVQSHSFRQEERYRYNARGQLERVDDNTGATRHLGHDDAGRVAAALDPLGRLTRYVHDDLSQLRQIVHAANTGDPLTVSYGRDAAGRLSEVTASTSGGVKEAGRSVGTRLLTDDFGREVATVSPDRGTVVRRYDEADRLRRIEDATGAVTEIGYDVAGRVTSRTTTQRQGAVPESTRFVYEDTWLLRIEHPHQTERYAYDDAGRVANKRVEITLAGGDRSMHATAYRYDAQGALSAQSLPDGSELHYERNGQGQNVALHRQATRWSWFGLGRTTLVKDLERDLVGLRRASYGNGVGAQWQRSREGVLARVVYTGPSPQPSTARTAFERLMSEARAQAAAPATPASAAGAFGMAAGERALWDGRLLFDAAGNIVAQGQFARSASAQPQRTGYAYDAHDQLVQASRAGDGAAELRARNAPAPPTVWRYHHDGLGNRLLAQEQVPAGDMAQTVKLRHAGPEDNRLADQRMDEAGRPIQDRERRYEWDALGRLRAIHQGADLVATYRYNHRAERVRKQAGGKSEHYLHDDRRHRLAELDAQGRLTRQYVWLADQLVAVIDFKKPQALRALANGVFDELRNVAWAIWMQVTGGRADVAYVHTNHLGAPVAMTDEFGKVVWQADYAPFGRRVMTRDHFGLLTRPIRG